MRTLGTVQLPTEAFMAVLKLDEDNIYEKEPVFHTGSFFTHTLLLLWTKTI